MDLAGIRAAFPVLAVRVPGRDGGDHPLRFFDHAASTHAPAPVLHAYTAFLARSYANVHRGAHHLSELATDAFEASRATVRSFVGAGDDCEVVFTMNTTQSLSLASHVACALADGPVLATRLEHHSNLLPHRTHGSLEMVPVTTEGRVDLDALETRLRAGPRPRLLALSCASNVTGVKTPLVPVLELAHDARVPVLLDGAQILAHERLDLARLPGGGPEYFAAAGHKSYAPFGSAFLVARRELLDRAPPWMPGGGTVKLVLEDEVLWAESPDRHEGGTPNVAGAVGLAAALKWIGSLDREEAEAREDRLFRRLWDGLTAIEGVAPLGPHVPDERVGVVSFKVGKWSPAAVATALDREAGVAVRHGCFCAHPYLLELLGVDSGPFVEQIRSGTSTSAPGIPGAVRASLGIYNSEEEVDALLVAVRALATRPPDSGYAWKGDLDRWVEAPMRGR
ncbi:MAG TPA: aminotransferase class V-fold PLP-dependent enzyme [Candidatus Thermoplasmatota archaeon]|nr:aminotransferase class V-fold PLP-dependent enzyme [Candidatus Thermoplasmatota archaeon]